MSGTKDEIKSVAWSQIFRWLVIFRSLAVACGPAVLVLATLGVLVTPLGWRVSELIFVNDTMREDPFLDEFANTMGSPYQGVFTQSKTDPTVMSLFRQRITGPMLVYKQIVAPFYHMFSDFGGIGRFLYYLFGGLCSLVVWAFLGTAIARIAVMRYSRDEAIGIFDALEFSTQRIVAVLGALTMPLMGVAGICILTSLFGLLMTFDFGLFLVSLVFFLVLGLVVIMAILLLGLVFGWPLAVAAVSAEGQDSFDAMTKSYAYTFQRPLHYLFYAFVAVVFGGLCWLLAARVADGIQNLSYWSTSWGANVSNSERIDDIRQTQPPIEADSPFDRITSESDDIDSTAGSENQRTWFFRSGQNIIHFWMSVVRTIAAAFLYGHFWCLAAAVYLLLRFDVDEMELDQVFVGDEGRSYDLPSLATQPDGVPQLDRSDSALPPDGDSPQDTEASDGSEES